ncbi:erythromycin esterase family protein [Kitasatospora sp. SUK 42]|uniref:erythromycin esterase family protein n=1 Tax=Kitasatospora sp. SUK 42 TaxID=1588882 RepID=UPI0018C949FD|nr:erythromycin esterase family protein [Kitasatospora sp. SUK 42]MBV2153077.1 erythromycin esterase family protein [Kitasatospora sp. SUK 42]
MTVPGMPISRRGLLAATAAVATTTVLTPAAATAASASTTAETPQQPAPIDELARLAHPLRSTEPGGPSDDLRALDAMIGEARVVGLGEATHGSHEFFALKHRVFRHLVEERGFTTFVLEASWSAGLLIDAYVQGQGGGDARQLADHALARSPWHRQEFADLIAWMRDHNRRHPRRPVHFVGDDLGLPGLGDHLFDRVTGYLRGSAPAALPKVEQLYAGLRPFDDGLGYLENLPLPERKRNAALAQQALELVAAAGAEGDREYEWAVQHARNIAQTFAFTTMDPEKDHSSVIAAQQLRDRAMADNVLWWRRLHGDGILLSAHNGHAGYLSSDPELYPKPQGCQLRDALGTGYRSIGVTFGQGSFLTEEDVFADDWRTTTVPPATPDMTEYTLDRVRTGDYYLDLRRTPSAARAWLATPRPTYDAGTTFERDPLPTLAIGPAYDLLVHLHRVRAAEKL